MNTFNSQNKPNPSFSSQPMNLSLGNLPTFGRGRPIGVVRPTPVLKQASFSGVNWSADKQNVKDELSPRSKMLPGLVERVNTIKGNGSFSKFERVGSNIPSNNVVLNHARFPENPKEFQSDEFTIPYSKTDDTKATADIAKVIDIDNSDGKSEKVDSAVKENTESKKKEKEIEEEVKIVKKPKPRTKGGKIKKKGTKAKAKQATEESEEGNLSSRKDVVYKTLLRSIKRYYSDEFESNTEYPGLSKAKQDKNCIEIITKFCHSMFSDHIQQK